MTGIKRWGLGVVLLMSLRPAPAALAQAGPTATQRFGLSVFGAGSGVYTDVFGGRNLSLTAGADLTLRSHYGLTPSLELRGTYPLNSGHVAGEKSVLAGLKVEKPLGRFHPYGDFLVGRGQVNYQNGGFISGSLLYSYSSSTVYSPGVGVDLDLSHHWALKADYQYQLWTTYPLEPKILKPSVITGGVVYRFDFNRRPRESRRRDVIVDRPSPAVPPQAGVAVEPAAAPSTPPVEQTQPQPAPPAEATPAPPPQ